MNCCIGPSGYVEDLLRDMWSERYDAAQMHQHQTDMTVQQTTMPLSPLQKSVLVCLICDGARYTIFIVMQARRFHYSLP